MEVNTSAFASVLRELMQKNPVTGEPVSQRTLADYLGVTAQSIYLYLSGRTHPECTQLLKIAGYFGVSVDYLLTGKQPENKTIRETLKLSDAAIKNLESCSEDFAPYVDMLLREGFFLKTYKECIESILKQKSHRMQSLESYIISSLRDLLESGKSLDSLNNEDKDLIIKLDKSADSMSQIINSCSSRMKNFFTTLFIRVRDK